MFSNVKVAVLVLLLSVTTCTTVRQQIDDSPCGYNRCPVTRPNVINVHIVPYSQNDLGRRKTVDQYYFGAKADIDSGGFQYILDSVVGELIHDPDKRFIIAEGAFFFKWWNEQLRSTQNTVTRLVVNGQLEFVGGGWSVNDESVAHYQSIIDQHTLGIR